MSVPENITGIKYNRVTPLYLTNERKTPKRRFLWMCVCDCGSLFKTEAYELKKGKVKSCGCLSAEKLKLGNPTHGLSKRDEYNIYYGIKERCYNKNNARYFSYGGAGIIMSERWLGENGFLNFLEDMGERPSPKHSIDRKNNSLGYFPSNCKWSTNKEQTNNKSTNKKVIHDGVEKTLSQASEDSGIPYFTLRKRIFIDKMEPRRWFVKGNLNLKQNK